MNINEFFGRESVEENLRQWFKEKWVRFGPDGKIRGDCARGDDSEGKPKCLPQSKAHSLGKKGRASAAARKRREDPNPERSGKAINVNTKKESVAEGAMPAGVIKAKKRYSEMTPAEFAQTHKDKSDEELKSMAWRHGYGKGSTHYVDKRNKGKKSVAEDTNIPFDQCPHCGDSIVHESQLNEKQDACYHKVKSRYKVWPSAYASGALVRCRKVGASNWGNKSKK